MKGASWILVLAALLGVLYLVTRDLKSVSAGGGDGKTVIVPIERASRAAAEVQRVESQVKGQLENAER